MGLFVQPQYLFEDALHAARSTKTQNVLVAGLAERVPGLQVHVALASADKHGSSGTRLIVCHKASGSRSSSSSSSTRGGGGGGSQRGGTCGGGGTAAAEAAGEAAAGEVAAEAAEVVVEAAEVVAAGCAVHAPCPRAAARTAGPGAGWSCMRPGAPRPWCSRTPA